jgi:hypothetical protein
VVLGPPAAAAAQPASSSAATSNHPDAPVVVLEVGRVAAPAMCIDRLCRGSHATGCGASGLCRRWQSPLSESDARREQRARRNGGRGGAAIGRAIHSRSAAVRLARARHPAA